MKSRKSCPEEVLLAFGSNLGDRQETLERAWSAVGDLSGVEAVRISRFHETRAVGGPPDQPGFLNAVGLVRCTLEPGTLLQRLQEIEYRFGRVRVEHWGPRTLDIDILLFGNRVLETPTLVIPHPEMLRRPFVLEPAMDVAATMIHPLTGRSLADHRAECPSI